MIDERFFRRTKIKTLADLCALPHISAMISDTDNLPLDKVIVGVNTLLHATHGELSFFDNIKYKQDFIASQAGFCVAKPNYISIAPETMVVIPSHDPYRLYAMMAEALYFDNGLSPNFADDYYRDSFGAFVHKNAVLEDGVQTAMGVIIQAHAEIGTGTMIHAGTVIERGVTIGRDCMIYPNVTISHALIGDRVHISSGVVIGQSGFGYAMGKTHISVPQLGRVIIQDDVHIGAATAIDRGTIGDTFIAEGCKIDNLVQIGHNVILGRHCVIAGQCAIAGSVIFDDYVVSGGQTCYAGHIHIGKMARIAGGAGVSRDIPAGETWAGIPAKPIKQNFREILTLEKLSQNGASKNAKARPR